MTENDAILELQQNIDLPFGVTVSDEASEMAIKALEKQIPKKPIYSDFAEDDDGEKIIPYKAVCPMCGCEFEFGHWNEEENHHCNCGQKLDWH